MAVISYILVMYDYGCYNGKVECFPGLGVLVSWQKRVQTKEVQKLAWK